MDDMDLLQRIRFVFTVAISLMLFAVICGLTLPKKTALVLLERLYDLGKALSANAFWSKFFMRMGWLRGWFGRVDARLEGKLRGKKPEPPASGGLV